MRALSFSALLLVALAAVGCDAAGDELELTAAERAGFEGQIDATLRALDLVVGDAAASDASACRVLALNEDPCGNPRLFRVYSAEGDTAAIRRLADEYERLSRAYDKRLGTVRECRVVGPPEVVFEDGRCTTPPVVVVD